MYSTVTLVCFFLLIVSENGFECAKHAIKNMSK